MNQSILYPEDVIKAYKTHGDNFIIIDFTTIKENQAKTVKYCQLKIKKENGHEVVPIIKLINLTVAGKIKVPSEREFEQLKVALRKEDLNNAESKFGEAMELICNTFTKKVKEMKSNGLINDDEDDDNNNKNTIIVPNCKPQTPLQKKAKGKDNANVNLDNPMIWLGLNFKRYTADEEKQLQILDNLTYKRDNKPFYLKDFDLSIYDLENVVNKKPQMAIDETQQLMNNGNIHKFITVNSLISGTIYMQVVMSKQSFNLNTKLSKNLYVKSNKNNSSNGNHMFDDNEFELMMGGAKPTTESTNTQKQSSEEDEEEYEVEYVTDDDEEDSNDIDKKLDNLKFN
jgi:hypothetical protein